MTADQRKSLDRLLRDLPFDLGGEVGEQRPLMEHMLTAQPLPDDVNVTARELGGVRMVEVGIGGVDPVGTILHLHGGGFALGSADSSVGMAAELARRTRTVVVSVDYALAPENPFPIAGEQVVAAYDALIEREGDGRRVVVSGESAGGNLALGLLLAVNGDDRRAPAGAVLLSPMTDLTASGASFTSKAAADPALSARAIVNPVGDYLNGTGVSAKDPTVSPVFADLHGLPPLLIQAGRTRSSRRRDPTRGQGGGRRRRRHPRHHPRRAARLPSLRRDPHRRRRRTRAGRPLRRRPAQPRLTNSPGSTCGRGQPPGPLHQGHSRSQRRLGSCSRPATGSSTV